MMGSAIKLADRSVVSIALWLSVSILIHVIVLIYILSATFPGLESILANAAKPQALTVYLTPVHAIANEKTETIATPDQEHLKIKLLTTESLNVESITKNIEEKLAYKDKSNTGSEDMSLLPVKYYALAELDKIPDTQVKVDTSSLDLMDYPQGGKVELRLWVNEFGKVVRVESTKSDMPADFVERATQLFMQAQFFPGTVKHEPVKFVSKIVIHHESTVIQGYNNFQNK